MKEHLVNALLLVVGIILIIALHLIPLGGWLISLRILGLILGAFLIIINLCDLSMFSINTYRKVMETGTEEQQIKAKRIIKIVGYSASACCFIIAFLVLFLG